MPDTQFEDGKDEGALRTIGEVSNALGIKTHVLRYWEQQFEQLEPLKRSGGRRYYRPEDVALIERIDQLVNREGYTLKGAEQALAGGGGGAIEGNSGAVEPSNEESATGTAEAESTRAMIERTPDEVLSKLKDIRASLEKALAA